MRISFKTRGPFPRTRIRVSGRTAAAWLGVIGTGAAYLLYYPLVENVGATTASAYFTA